MNTLPYLEQENKDFCNVVYNFAKEQIYPSVQERDEKDIWDSNLWKKIAEIGLTGIAIPKEYGGLGFGCLETAQTMQTFACGSADAGLSLALGAHIIFGSMPIVLFGTEEQKQKYLTKIASGEWIAGLGLTEPGSGSDAASLLTTAKDNGDHYLLNGSKMFITNGPIGDVFVVMARTKEGRSRSPIGLSAFIVEKSFPGFSVGNNLKKLGMRTSTTCELIFEDMKVPKENLLGPLHSGFLKIGKATLEWERIVLVSGGIGSLEYVLYESIQYARERQQFGTSIASFYAIQEKLAKMWVYAISSVRYMSYICKGKDEGRSLPLEASLSKMLVTEFGDEAARESIQVFGGYGFICEYNVERIYRDVKLGTIGAGTSEVMRSIVFALFSSAEKYQATLEFMQDEEIKKSIETSYSTSIGGELELLFSLKELLFSVFEHVKKKKTQMFEFAFAELVGIYTLLLSTYWDCGVETPDYSLEDKKRDFLLLSYFVTGKYIHSIRNLSQLDSSKGSKVLQAYLNLKNIEETVIQTANRLLERY